MKPLRAAVNLGEKIENLCPSADVLHNTSNLIISRCSFADGGREIDKKEKRTCRACKATAFAYCCNVLVAVAVVVAKAP